MTDYDIQIASDAAFSSIVESANVLTNSYEAQNLQDGTTYYWRIRPNNPCAAGNFSSIRTFTTSQIVCSQYNSSDTPLSIPDNNPGGVSSVISVTEDFIVSDVNVIVNITHTWMEDLTLVLESPQGTRVELVSEQCSGATGNRNMAATFDDLGVDLVCASSSPVITGTIKPSEDLAGFNGESSLGDWTLTVVDGANLDEGTLSNWTLELCESVAVAGVENNQFQNLGIWPNPANGLINISFLASNAEDTEVKIFDILGREVVTKTFTSNSVLFKEQLEINGLSSGTYLVKISRGNANTTKRIVVF